VNNDKEKKWEIVVPFCFFFCWEKKKKCLDTKQPPPFPRQFFVGKFLVRMSEKKKKKRKKKKKEKNKKWPTPSPKHTVITLDKKKKKHTTQIRKETPQKHTTPKDHRITPAPTPTKQPPIINPPKQPK